MQSNAGFWYLIGAIFFTLFGIAEILFFVFTHSLSSSWQFIVQAVVLIILGVAYAYVVFRNWMRRTFYQNVGYRTGGRNFYVLLISGAVFLILGVQSLLHSFSTGYIFQGAFLVLVAAVLFYYYFYFLLKK